MSGNIEELFVICGTGARWLQVVKEMFSLELQCVNQGCLFMDWGSVVVGLQNNNTSQE